jgi:hypothetical protein
MRIGITFRLGRWKARVYYGTFFCLFALLQNANAPYLTRGEKAPSNDSQRESLYLFLDLWTGRCVCSHGSVDRE